MQVDSREWRAWFRRSLQGKFVGTFDELPGAPSEEQVGAVATHGGFTLSLGIVPELFGGSVVIAVMQMVRGEYDHSRTYSENFTPGRCLEGIIPRHTFCEAVTEAESRLRRELSRN